MQKLERLLVSCSQNIPPGQAVRNLIGFKRNSSYRRCLKELSRLGIAPVKNINGSRMICCSVNKLEKRLLLTLANHPHIRFIEPDYKIRAHSLTASPVSKPGSITKATPVSGAGKASASRSVCGTAAKIGNKSGVTVPADRRSRTAASKRAWAADVCPAGITWNVRRVQAPRVWRSTRGNRIGIGIIDTGIARHPDLRIAGGVNTIGGASYDDDNGHGTHVAGIAAALGTKRQIPGVAPRVDMYAVKALDANGEGYISDIIEGIEWCIKKRIPVINMSLGLNGGGSSALRSAIRRARKKGIVVTASAGNSGVSSGGIDEPARYAESIAVAASTIHNKIAAYSSRGNGIDITAPGSLIKSTWLNGGYNILSGTSMAAPHAAGAAALLLARQPGLSPAQVSARLKSSALKLNGYSSLAQGAGLLQIADAFALSRSTRCRMTGRWKYRNTKSGQASVPYLDRRIMPISRQ